MACSTNHRLAPAAIELPHLREGGHSSPPTHGGESIPSVCVSTEAPSSLLDLPEEMLDRVLDFLSYRPLQWGPDGTEPQFRTPRPHLPSFVALAGTCRTLRARALEPVRWTRALRLLHPRRFQAFAIPSVDSACAGPVFSGPPQVGWWRRLWRRLGRAERDKTTTPEEQRWPGVHAQAWARFVHVETRVLWGRWGEVADAKREQGELRERLARLNCEVWGLRTIQAAASRSGGPPRLLVTRQRERDNAQVALYAVNLKLSELNEDICAFWWELVFGSPMPNQDD